MKILLPVDGSSASLAAVALLVRLVDEGLRASAVLANVQEPASLYELLRLHDAQAIERISAGAAATALEAAQMLLERAHIEYESVVGSGDPAHTLVDLIERNACDAVFMGSRGLGTLRIAAIGSVANEVLHAASVPVTIVKPPADIEAEARDSDDVDSSLDAASD
ncbi:MAG: universal stress protein [Burkholderiaceae bacterium]